MSATKIIRTGDGTTLVKYGPEIASAIALTDASRIAAQTAETAAELAQSITEAISGPNYPDTTAGLAATVDTETFAVDNGDGTVTIYLNGGGVAVAQRTLATSAALAADTGAALIKFTPQGTGAIARDLQDKISQIEITPADYGVLGVDDGPEIQKAFDAVAALGGGRVSFKAYGYKTGQELILPSNIELFGAGENVSTITAIAGLGHDNILSATGQSGIRIKGLGFIGLNQTVTPDFLSTAKENNLYFMSCSDVIIDGVACSRALNRTIYFDASFGAPMRDIFVRHVKMSDGSRGGIFVVRYATNVHVHGIKSTNIVNSAIGGITFEKSVALTGVTNGFMYDIEVIQTNTDAASVIAEYNDTPSVNIHMFRIVVDYAAGQTSDNCIKAGAVIGLKVYDCVGKRAKSAGLFLEGCENYDVQRNAFSFCGDNGIKVISDTSPTTLPSKRGKIGFNTITDCNKNGGALGTVGAISGDAGSYAIFVEATSSEVDIFHNTYIDSGNTMNGLRVNSATYTIKDDDYRALNAARITINNLSSSASTQWLIRDNKGAQTTDQGKATMADATNSISVVPDIVGQYDPNVQVTPKAAFSGTVAYCISAPDTIPGFVIQTKTSAHATANVVGALEFNWTADLSTTARGIFGKTVR